MWSSTSGFGVRGVPLPSLVGIYAQLGRMHDAGLSITEALRLVARHSSGAARDALERMRDGIEAGGSFAEVASRERTLFAPSHDAVIVAGERAGTLSAVLFALSASLELRLDVRRQLLRACLYPFVLLTLVFFVPKIHLLITDGVGAYLVASLVPFSMMLGVLIALAIVVPLGLRAALGGARTEKVLQQLPVVGPLRTLASQVRFCRHLGGTLGAGLDTYASLDLAARASGDPRWIEALGPIERRVRSGASLEQAVDELGWVEGSMILAVAAGERSGTLPEAMEQHARIDQAAFTHRLSVAIQLASVLILLSSYAYAASAVLSEYQAVQESTERQLKEILGGEGGGDIDDLLRLK